MWAQINMRRIRAGGRAYGRVHIHITGPNGAGGVLLLIRTHLTRRCPLFYYNSGQHAGPRHRFS